MFVSKFGISAAFNIVIIANPILFPPLFLATAFGITNTFARLVTVLAPYVAELNQPIPIVVFIVCAGGAMVASLFIIPAPEEDNGSGKTPYKSMVNGSPESTGRYLHKQSSEL